MLYTIPGGLKQLYLLNTGQNKCIWKARKKSTLLPSSTVQLIAPNLPLADRVPWTTLINLWSTNANIGAFPLNCVLMMYVQLQVYAFARATEAGPLGVWSYRGSADCWIWRLIPFMFQTPPWDKPTFWDLLWIQEHQLFEQQLLSFGATLFHQACLV